MTVPQLLLLSCGLFAIGIFGVLTRRNAIAILLAIELLLNASSLACVAFGRAWGAAQGQVVALFIIALAACEVAVGLAVIIGLYRTLRTVIPDAANTLRG